MPRGKAVPAKETKTAAHPPRFSPQEDEWGGFVSVKVEAPEREKFMLWWGENEGNVWHMLTDCLSAGLKLSVSWDGANQSTIATFTGRPSVSPEWPFRCSMSARAGELFEAVALLIYKEYIVTGNDWTPWTPNGRRQEVWG